MDKQLLNKLLYPPLTIQPVGSKYYMKQFVLDRRQRSGVMAYALLDGDFVYPWTDAGDVPRRWEENGDHLGWRWSRKEIENYLLEVAGRALGWSAAIQTAYEEALKRAAERLAYYQAARAVLSSLRPRPHTLENRWGKPRGRHNYPFPEEAERDDATCQQQLGVLIRELEGHRLPAQRLYQGTLVHDCLEDDCKALGINVSHPLGAEDLERLALRRYAQLLPSFLPGGSQRKAFLRCFAGKDLLWAIKDDLVQLGQRDTTTFLEKIITAITDTREDVATWLPEWTVLRQLVLST